MTRSITRTIPASVRSVPAQRRLAGAPSAPTTGQGSSTLAEQVEHGRRDGARFSFGNGGARFRFGDGGMIFRFGNGGMVFRFGNGGTIFR